MKRAIPAVPLLLVLVLSGLSPLSSAGIGAGSKLAVETQTQMLFRTGGGYINWELAGPAVVDVRRNIDLNFGDGDGNITELEGQAYIGEIDGMIENFIFYGSAHIVQSSLLNKDIQTDTEDLMGPVNSSRDIIIHFTFNANLRIDGATVNFGDLRIPLAVFHALDGEPNQTFDGKLEWRHTEIVVGVASFSSVQPHRGSFSTIRGPGVEVLWYSLSIENLTSISEHNRTISDLVRFDTFSVVQCPLELFAVMCVFGAFTLWLPRHFMKAKKMLKVRFLHWLAILLVAVSLALVLAGADGIFVWVSSPLFMALSGILSFGIYSRGWKGLARPAGPAMPMPAAPARMRPAAASAPDRPGPSGPQLIAPHEPEPASPPVSWDTQTSTRPETPFLVPAQQAPPPQVTGYPRELRCPKCKAVFVMMDSGVRPMAIRCTSCGTEGVLRK